MGDLASARKYLEKSFGKGILMNLTGAVELHKCISTGHPFIDYVMGGGMPYGKMIELFGQPSSGKTTLASLIAAQAQRIKNKTGRVLLVDYEHAFDLRYFKKLGGLIDEDHFIVTQPETAEEGLEIMRVFIAQELCDLIIVDSVAAMMSVRESGDWVDSSGNKTEDGKGKQLGAMGEQQIGLHARVITQGMKQIQAKIGPPEIGVIWINQIRTKIGTQKGQQTTETTTGGHAIKFYSAIRVEMQRIKSKMGKLYDPIENKILDNKIVAIETRVKGVKNRTAPPFREGIVTVTFGQGLDTEGDLLRMAANHALVEKGKTGWYSTTNIGASRNARGEEDFRKLLKEEPKVRKNLIDKVEALMEKIADTGGLQVISVDSEQETDPETLNKVMSAQPTFKKPEPQIKPPSGEAKATLTKEEPPDTPPSDEDVDALLSGEPENPQKGEATTETVSASPESQTATPVSVCSDEELNGNPAVQAILRIPDP